MFDDLDFKTATATSGRSGSNDPVSITHSFKTKKNEMLFRLTKECMDASKLTYGNKVHIQFAANNTVCRVIRTNDRSGVTISQQTKDNELSAGIIRLTYKNSLPNFLEIESKSKNLKINKVRYVHENDKIQYGEGDVTFQLKLDMHEEEK
ncbi:hypothetical protein [Aliivibrio kagoshimensis]|uniref:hypothetical protein n=1 Tax=Aliivibrio kagoshimensis TaxID=2910230 RepID=UPI003D0F23CB